METIESLAKEMQSFLFVKSSVIEKAEKSKVTTKNNQDFKTLVLDWGDGKYDEDPNCVIQEIEWILSQELKTKNK